MPSIIAKVQTALAEVQTTSNDRQRSIERALELNELYSDIKPETFVLPIGNLTLCNARSEITNISR